MGQPISLLCGSVWREDSERVQCHYLASGGFPSTHPISNHFTCFPCATGTLPAVALVVNLRMGGFAYTLSLCVPFKWTFLKNLQFLLLLPPPLDFTTRSYGDLSFQCWNPRLCSLSWGWDPLLPRYPS